ncbi:SDR family NAD(P)-dependent oxidoreductase [Pusillimonas sp. NJUB218]|uniref:SDR family NAD(P)-dependent oxidoreductase n=1 Tax=Pusillimonas sp. NJUB218 TaxID=2023230 RepID=UPI001315333B|nr:SDR family oxidoreductase [Pusillimonas sp. NJUB218]
MKAIYDFSGHVVLVVGAASGIGRETALACAAVGAQVLAMDIDSEGLSTLAGGNIDTRSVDIADSGAVDSAIQDWQKQYGRIDAAVLTSAIQKRTLIDELSNAEWQRHLDVNLTGVFYLLRALFPIMKRQRSGAIVAFTSGLASAGWPGAAAYASTKAGIIGLVKSAALELRAFGVRINAVSPGLVATPVFLKSATDDELAMYEKSLGVSAPDEVVPSLMFLISDSAKTVSGNVFERRLVPRAE